MPKAIKVLNFIWNTIRLIFWSPILILFVAIMYIHDILWWPTKKMENENDDEELGRLADDEEIEEDLEDSE